MAVFRYRLEALLDQKHEAKEAAQRKLAACRAEEGAAQAQLEEMEAKVREAAELKTFGTPGVEPGYGSAATHTALPAPAAAR